jgi:hypothetical protein
LGAKVNRFLVNVAQHFVSDLSQPDFGVAHGRSVVTVYRAEVALAVDQHVAHGEILRHAHDGVVDRLVTVWMVFADHVAYDTGRLFIRAVPVVVQLMHGEQHATVHRLQTISGIGQCAAHDHTHGVIEVAAPHFLFQTDGQCFFGELSHKGKGWWRCIRFSF